MNKDYVYESPDGGKTVYRREMGTTKKELVEWDEWISDPTEYADLISLDSDMIDLDDFLSDTSTISIVDPYIFNTKQNKDVTMEIDGKERSMRELFSTVDAIKDRLAILEPKKELLDKYELLQSLYEQYKAAEAMLSGPDIEDEE